MALGTPIESNKLFLIKQTKPKQWILFTSNFELIAFVVCVRVAFLVCVYFKPSMGSFALSSPRNKLYYYYFFPNIYDLLSTDANHVQGEQMHNRKDRPKQ